MSIIREPTTEEKKDFQNIGFKEDMGKAKFENELAKAGQEAIKKGLPFAEKAARDEFKDYYESQVRENIRKNGYLDVSEIKPLKMDFSKFMDVKNFELLDEGEIADQNMSKHNPGLDVRVAFKKWKFKGYNNTYTVMESGPDAILRARKKLKELESETKKK